MVNKSFNNFKNSQLNNFLKDLEKEWNNQDKKFPNQIHELHSWLVIIMEEFGELCKESLELRQKEFNFTKMYKEMIQTITLLIRVKYSIYEIRFDGIFI